MHTSFDSLQFYTQALTGIILLLNLALLVSVQLALKWLKNGTVSAQAGSSPRRALGLLVMVVIAMNGLAIYSNTQLRRSTKEVIADFGGGEPAGSLANR